MAPHSRCSPEQKEFLLKHVSGFLEAQKKGRLDKFWVILDAGWFRQWEVVEDASIVDVDARQKAYGEEVASWKKYTRRWYQNYRAKQARVQPYGRLVKRVLKTFKSKRRPQLLEVYCRLFYKDHVLPHVKAEVARLTLLNGNKPTRGQRLRLIRDFSAKVFDDEPEEIKDQVTAVYEKCKDEANNEEEEEADKSPQAYADAIDTIPAQFTEFSQLLSSLTGWKFTLLAGGPDPTNEGRIRSISVHGGENHAGLSFGQACPEFKGLVSAPFGNFLRTAYTPSECAARALYPIESEADSMASTPNFPAVTVAHSAVTLPLDEPPVPVIQPEFEFDHVDEDIDWEALNLFDPLQDGAFGGLPRLSLTDELAAPLFPGFAFDADLLPQIPQTHDAAPGGAMLLGEIVLPLPFLPASIDINMTDETIPTQTQLGMTNTATIAPVAAPVPTRSNEPVNAIADITAPTRSAGTADIASVYIPDEAATTGSVLGASATGAKAKTKLAKKTSTKGANKRSRDPTDEALIVPGKRVRKAKDRREVEEFMPQGKENRPPKALSAA